MKNELKEDLVKKTNDLSLNKEEKNEKNPSEEDKKVEEKDIVKKGDTQKKEPVVVPQQTLLILDASGSMWGQIDGRAKIDIAKEVVKKTVKNFENTDLGLMAYGHRRKGDCSDIEILATPQKNNAENIAKMVDGISPKGMTPMGASVLMAAESLKYTEQKATIILVSDGIETCDVDLCELGKKLEEAGVDVYIGPGNHDTYSGTCKPTIHYIEKRHGSLFRQYYHFEKGGLNFFCCGIYPNYAVLLWLRWKLWRIGSDAPIVLFFHYLCF